jgi:hypothetical protein
VAQLESTLPTSKPNRARLLILAPILLLVLVWVWRTAGGGFNSLAWQMDTNYAKGGPRARMVDDLLKNGIRPGMSQREVVSMLGNEYEEVGDVWFYHVYQETIPDGPYNMPYFKDLMIKFDLNGRLLKAELVGEPPKIPTSRPGYMSPE